MSPSGKTNDPPQKTQQIHEKKTKKTSPPSIAGPANNPNNSETHGHNKKQNSKCKWEPLTFFTMLLVIVGSIQAVTMWHTVSDSRKTQRAFVYASKFNYRLAGDMLIIQPIWENSGTTPTRRMINSVSKKIFENNESIDNFTFPDLDENGNPRKDTSGAIPVYIGPKGSVYGGSVGIPIKYAEAASKRQCRIFVYGWTEYDDVFSWTKRHRTEFCREIILTNFEKITTNTFNIGYMDVFWKYHNCSDDECK